MTEAEAHSALRAFVAVGELERWIAAQLLEAVLGGWRVRARLHAWRFRLEPVLNGSRGHVRVRGGAPAVWAVPNPPERRTRT